MGKNFSWVTWLKEEKANADQAPPTSSRRSTRRKVYKALVELGAVDPEGTAERPAPAPTPPNQVQATRASSRKMRTEGAA